MSLEEKTAASEGGGSKADQPKRRTRTRREKLHRLVVVLQVLLALFMLIQGIQGLARALAAGGILDYASPSLQLLSGALLTGTLFSLPKTRVLRQSVNLVILFWILSGVTGRIISPLLYGTVEYIRLAEDLLLYGTVTVFLLIVRLEKM